MTVTDPIRQVSVVSTGQVQIRPDHLASSWRPAFWWLLASRRWTGTWPINAYVIEHRDGLVLFDTGQDRASVTDPGYFPAGMTGFPYARLARFEIGPQQTLSAGLGRLGYAPGDISTAVVPICTRTWPCWSCPDRALAGILPVNAEHPPGPPPAAGQGPRRRPVL
jgi:N-acyl homoserine lactone hydrolase